MAIGVPGREPGVGAQQSEQPRQMYRRGALDSVRRVGVSSASPGAVVLPGEGGSSLRAQRTAATVLPPGNPLSQP